MEEHIAQFACLLSVSIGICYIVWYLAIRDEEDDRFYDKDE